MVISVFAVGESHCNWVKAWLSHFGKGTISSGQISMPYSVSHDVPLYWTHSMSNLHLPWKNTEEKSYKSL